MKLMVIDGNSLMYRAFYAMSPVPNSDGLCTNAVYGFMNMLLKAIDDHSPSHIAVAFDVHGKTFRHDKYPEYKGNRSPTPDELRPQFPMIKRLLNSMKIAIVEAPGFEADDILGTLANTWTDKEIETVLITGDKDILQLINQNTKVLLTKRGLSDIDIYDDELLYSRYGLNPWQIPELKGLMGDNSDNIPGIRGVGEKTALKLLYEFKSIDELYNNTDKLKGKLKEKIVDGKDSAFLSRSIAVIKTDIDLDDNLDNYKFISFEQTDVLDALEDLHFTRLLARIRKMVGQEIETKFEIPDVIEPSSINEIENIAQELIESKNISIYLDENLYISDGTKEYKISLVMDLLGNGFDINEVFLRLKKLLCSRVNKTVYSKKTWLNLASQMGIELNNIGFDIELCAYVLNMNRRGGYENILESVLRTKHGGAPAFMMLILEKTMRKMLKQRDQEALLFDMEMPLTDVIHSIELEGFCIDKKILEDLGETIQEEVKQLTQDIYDHAGIKFNINSPKQLGEVLFEKLNLTVIKRTKTGYSTNIHVLKQLYDEHKIIPIIMRYRQLTKLKSTYIDNMIPIIGKHDNKIHTKLDQMGTSTGRFSSSDPNLQNIPVRTELGREIRKAFIASDARVLVDADYSQIELRVLAHMAQDRNMLDAFVNGVDIHIRTATQVFGVDIKDVTSKMRAIAKTVNFGIVYGISDFGLSSQLNITQKKAHEFIEKYFEAFKNVKQYMDDTIEFGKKHGYVKTMFDRRIYLPDLNASNFSRRSAAQRVAMNAPIQGTAADIIKLAMIALKNKLEYNNLKSKLILQVHDELIVDTYENEVDKVKEIIITEMQNAVKLDCELTVDVSSAKSWYEAK